MAESKHKMSENTKLTIQLLMAVILVIVGVTLFFMGFYAIPVGEISASVAKQLGKHKPISIPYWMAWCMAKVGDLLGSKAPINTYKLEKMTKSLTFSNEKARKELGWEPLDVLSNYKID